ncbi:hypothetical protein DITRI_Ditri16bG0009900 [Diplodiscus trichospermus]
MGGKQAEASKSSGLFWWLLVLLIGALVVAAAVLTILRDFHYFKKNRAPSQPINKKYADALEIALQFFDVQKSGKLDDNRISWRGDSGLQDGSEGNLDFSKGLYDAGDAMKFGFPMAFTATVLSWAILEYGDQMNAVKQLGYAQNSLRWITDYLINAHPSENVLYIQVGDPEIDHKCWERPETMSERRPLIQVNTSFPGTEVVAETAAALASASLVFKKIDTAYSNSLLEHAQQLFRFADTYRGSYSNSIPQVQKFYNSTGYGDELLWAGSWLYHATWDKSYLRYVTELNAQGFAYWESTWFSWDDKLAGTQVLLSRINFFGAKDVSTIENIYLQMYRKSAEAVICGLLPDSPTATSRRTDGGLIWISEWNSLQHPVAAAFLAVLYSDYMLTSQTETLYCSGNSYKPDDLRKFAMSQADYVLGANPMKISYLVGHGSSYPRYVHHRGSSIPVDADTGCQDGFKWLYSDNPNPNIAVGALVGGPSLNDSYSDTRNNSKQGEPSTYNSALIVGLLSGPRVGLGTETNNNKSSPPSALELSSAVNSTLLFSFSSNYKGSVGSDRGFFFSVCFDYGKGMAAGGDLDLSTLQSQLSETHELWKQEMEKGQSQVDILQAKIMEVKACIQGSEEESKELDVLWRRVKTTATLLTYLKSKARVMAIPDLAHKSCGIKLLEGVGLVDKEGTPLSGWSRSVDLSSVDCLDDETWIGISRQQGSLDEQDGAYIGELIKSVQMVTDVMEVLVKRVIMAESETALEKEKVTLGLEEIKEKAVQIENMSLKLEEMERFALGTNGILNEMRQRVEDLVEETSRQRQRAADNEQELSRVKQDFESLKSYVSSLISVRETLLSSEKQFQTIERLFERLVAKTTQLEGEKKQKEAEVQKLMEENVRLTTLLDKKEAQLLAMNEQCKVMALSASNI